MSASNAILNLGDYSKPKPKGYMFNINEWVDVLNIEFNGERYFIDPRSYFITSGEAVIKTDVLEHELWTVYKKILSAAISLFEDEDMDPLQSLRSNKLYKIDANLQHCLSSCFKCACQARHLSIHLIQARGNNLFLETDWLEGNIICYPKNPRGVVL